MVVETGTVLGETLTGSEQADTLDGAEGNDIILGLGGDDSLIGGFGADSIDGGGGDDTIIGTTDLIVDFEALPIGADTLIGGSGNDSISGYGNSVFAQGGSGNDTIFGGPDNFDDTLDGGSGDDLMVGQGGADVYIVDSLLDFVGEYTYDVMGPGNTATGDVDEIRSTITWALRDWNDDGFNVENLTLLGNDDINATGNEVGNVVTGNDGDNILNGGSGGDDTLLGGGGNDTLIGGTGDDVLSGGAVANALVPGDEADPFDFLDFTDYLVAPGDVSASVGADGNTFVFAPGDGNDTITDFNFGTDILDFGAFVDAFDAVTTEDANGDRVITINGDVSVTLQGVPLNYAPVINSTAPGVATQGIAFSYALTTNDPDGDTVTFDAANSTLPGWLTYAGNGIFTGTPAASDVGPTQVVIAVTDGRGGMDTQTFDLVVDPILTQTESLQETVNEGEDVTFAFENLLPPSLLPLFPDLGSPQERIAAIELLAVSTSSDAILDEDYTFSYTFGDPQIVLFSALEDDLVEDDETVQISVTGYIDWIVPSAISGLSVVNVLGDFVTGTVERVAIDITLTVTINSAPEGIPFPIEDYRFTGPEVIGNVLTNFADGSGELFSVLPFVFDAGGLSGQLSANGDLTISSSTALQDQTVALNFTVIDERGALTQSQQVIEFGAPADDFLPGDTAGVLGSALVGVPTTGTLEINGDRDRFEVSLEAGVVYDIALEGAPTGGGTLPNPEIIGVFDSTGALVTGSADDNSGVGTNALVTGLVVETDGFYEIEVASAQDLGVGDYTLSVDAVGFVDDFLPGVSGGLGSVAINGRTTGEIETSGDIDGFTVTLQANTTYEISILGQDSNNGTLVDPDLLGVFSTSDLSGTPLASVQTLNTQFVGDDSTSYFTPQSAGEYFIGVQDEFGGVGTYTVSVTNIGVRDDFAADIETTGTIVSGGSAVGRIDFAQDEDWFEVNLSANRLYEINLVPIAGGNALADPFFRGIYDSNGVLIQNTENDDGGTGTSSALQFVTDDAGTFYFAASGFGDTTGQYRLELNDLGPLDDNSFDITIEYTSDDVPDAYIQAFEDAVERWEEVITGDLPYAFVEGYGYVDDILIEVDVTDIELTFEGVDQRILALSTVLDQRSDSTSGSGALPTYSRIVINAEEVGVLLNLDELVMNTIGRALGFGSLWVEFGLVRDIGGIATYTGVNGLREIAELSDDLNGQNVLEDGSDGALAAEYWSEDVLDAELMTSRVELRTPLSGPGNPNVPDNPISELTIAAMEDLGYEVDYGAADFFRGTGGNPNFGPSGTVTITGSTIEDSSLTAVPTLADANGLGPLSYQWLRGGVPIAGATTATYTLTQADVGATISVRVSYTDGLGTAESVESTATAAVTPSEKALDETGTDGPNTFEGTSLNDKFDGLGGNDTASGGEGDDGLKGGDGDDSLDGGPGNDKLPGGNGNDIINGGPGNDRLGGGFGNDHMDGGSGNDGGGAGPGNDTIIGGEGNDRFNAGYGNDLINMGPGDDTSGGSFGNDTIFGEAGNDLLGGADGNDVIDGGSGDDIIISGLGDDTVTGGEGADQFLFNSIFGGGITVITDFEDGIDTIRLVGLRNPPDPVGRLGITDTTITDGAFAGQTGVEMTYGRHTIIVLDTDQKDFSASDFTEDDFLFV